MCSSDLKGKEIRLDFDLATPKLINKSNVKVALIDYADNIFISDAVDISKTAEKDTEGPSPDPSGNNTYLPGRPAIPRGPNPGAREKSSAK